MMGKHAGPNEVVPKAPPFRVPRKIDVGKQSLSDILRDLDILDNSAYTPEEKKVVETAKGDAKFSYDEWIPAGLASTLLGKDFDPKCKYKLITQLDATTVLKVDDRIPADSPPVLDENGRIVSAHTMEYVLQEEKESYEADPLPEQQVVRDFSEPRKKVQFSFAKVFTAVMLGLVAVWLVFMLYIVTHGGM